jgi:NADPH:quinone reductase-like Zn-dependent oxidoreductase
VPKPEPKDDEVLVKVKASSVNPVDWKIRQGSLQIVTGWNFPKTLGSDFCGVVEAVGKNVDHIKIGETVYGMINAVKGGAYAEYLAVNANQLVTKPHSISDVEAASIPLAALTALQGLKKAQIAAGQKILVNGASGGVGHFAVQIAKAYGAEVTGVSSGKHTQMVKDLGADHHIDYQTETVLTGQPTYDLIFDAHGSLDTRQAEDSLHANGHYISTLPSVGIILHKIKSAFSKGDKHFATIWTDANATDLSELKTLVEEGKLKPIIEKSFALDDIDEAHRLSEEGHIGGKVVVTI